MKRADVKRRTAEGVTFDTQIMANPANTAEWQIDVPANGEKTLRYTAVWSN